MRQKPARVVSNYKTRDGRIVPLARVSASGRVYRIIWKHCASCGAAYLAVRSDARYCSNKCRQSAHRRRHALRRILQQAKTANAGLFQDALL